MYRLWYSVSAGPVKSLTNEQNLSHTSSDLYTVSHCAMHSPCVISNSSSAVLHTPSQQPIDQCRTKVMEVGVRVMRLSESASATDASVASSKATATSSSCSSTTSAKQLPKMG